MNDDDDEGNDNDKLCCSLAVSIFDSVALRFNWLVEIMNDLCVPTLSSHDQCFVTRRSCIAKCRDDI
jgi:hypothetical protein